MKLFVMRHGPAEDDAPSGRDADRALTPAGRQRTHAVARALLEASEAPLSILSSPLVRALQTAEIVAAATELERRVAESKRAGGSTGAVEIRRELAPGGPASSLVTELFAAGRKRVMIVGHEPDLSLLLEHLVGKAPPQGMLKSMVVGVSIAAGEASAFTAYPRFVLDPKSLAWERS